MQRIIKESDTFQLLIKENIDGSDYQYLFMLYQPIIGVNATNLYLTLVQEKHLTDRINLDFNHTRLMLLLNIDQFELLNAFRKLETYQLLVSYYYPLKSTYIYQLKKPLNASDFFNDEQLKAILINKIGSLQFERQKYYFLKHQPEITEEFIMISDDHKVNHEEANPKNKINLQQLMNNLNKAQSTLPEIKPIINNSTSSYYQLKANLEASSTIKVDSTNTPINKAVLNQTLSLMQEKKPEEYLITLTKKPIDNKLKNTLKLLTFSYQLNNEVINCLLEYVWFKNNKRIEPNYILKIGKTFHENKINNVSDALNHLKLAYQKSKKHSYSHKNKYQQDVLWTNDSYDFDWKKRKTNDDDNLMSEKEITEILKEFDKY